MATKSKPHSLSARRSSPRTRSGAPPKPISAPATRSRFVPEPNSTPGTDKIPRRTSFSFKTIAPIAGTLKSVTLSEWWLTKKNGLGVAGFESKDGSEVRLFSSGTISTRHDSTTLETSDGFTVSITGFIDRSRSLQNGFSSEVCNRFLLGFPYHWRDYTEEGFVQEEEKELVGVAFDDVPVNRYQDVLFTASPSFKAKILDEVLVNLRDLLRPVAEKPDKECEEPDKGCEGSDKECCVVPAVEGMRTRGMLRKRRESEASLGERVFHRSCEKKNKVGKFLLN